MASDSLRLLLVCEGYLPDYALGSTLYAHALATGLARRHQVEVLARGAEPSAGQPLTREERDGIPILRLHARTPGFPDRFGLEYRDPEVERRFESLLAEGRYDLVHFLHTLNLSAGLIPAARRAGAAAVAMLHDYWYLCHRIVLLDYRDARCPAPRYANGARCLFCAFHRRKQLAFGAGSSEPWTTRAALALLAPAARPLPTLLSPLARIARRRQRGPAPPALAAGTRAAIDALLYRPRWMRDALLAAQRWIAFSPHVVEHYQRLELPLDRFRVLPPGLLPPSDSHPRSRGAAPPSGPPWILGYAGGLLPAKGLALLVEAARNLIRDPALAGRFRIELHGGPLDSDFAAWLRGQIAALPIELFGPFSSAAREPIFGRFHLLVLPSQSEETYSFAVREAQSFGVPALVSDLPAQNRAIEPGRTGWTFRPGDALDLARALSRLLSAPGPIERARQLLLRQAPPPPFNEHVEAVEAVFREAIDEQRQGS
ncbi:MAG TPA: glycosyltransferase [Acidobacteriota bacterium]